MKNHYKIDEPAAISFSGGRTSAYMLYKILEAHDGELPDFVKVTFANTGKEFHACLSFVDACSKNWDVPITWLEYAGKKQFREVDYKTAARKGEPFAQLIDDKKYLPNMVARFCTSELKVLTIQRYMESIGMNDFVTVIGIRADEPRRVAKMATKENYLMPLDVMKVTEKDIYDFWDAHSFDLQLPKGTSNCTLCFLKGQGIKQSLIRESKDGRIADWWIEQEEKIGSYFRVDQPSYAVMKEYNGKQLNMFDESISCFCGD